jgi:hypothetical protein
MFVDSAQRKDRHWSSAPAGMGQRCQSLSRDGAGSQPFFKYGREQRQRRPCIPGAVNFGKRMAGNTDDRLWRNRMHDAARSGYDFRGQSRGQMNAVATCRGSDFGRAIQQDPGLSSSFSCRLNNLPGQIFQSIGIEIFFTDLHKIHRMRRPRGDASQQALAIGKEVAISDGVELHPAQVYGESMRTFLKRSSSHGRFTKSQSRFTKTCGQRDYSKELRQRLSHLPGSGFPF